MRGGGRGLAWSVVTLAVLLWPAKIPGVFDGAPLDGAVEAVAIGLIVPLLCWFYPAFFRARLAQILIVGLALVRIADAQLTQGGLCVRFDPQRVIVKDSTGRPHSWDVRADWRSPDPACSAVMTTGWTEFKRFPVWFFNLPPADNNLPTPDDRPPYTTLKMTVVGYLDIREPGSLDLQIGRYTPTTMVVDGRPAGQSGESSYRIDLDPGVHLLQIDSLLHSNQWHFNAAFNQRTLGTAGFPLVTIERPASRDRGLLRAILGWSTTILTAVFVLWWIVAALRAWGDVTTLVWAAAASIWLAFLVPGPGNGYMTTPLAKWSIAALGLAALLPVREPLRTLRGAFVVIGIPWLVFVGVTAFDHVAKFSFYAGGDDQWTFQRLAYRIFLQGYWLEGGERTFWFQPGYRWLAGAWHMVFGDSSIGEFHWDGICLAIVALFACEAVRRVAGFKAGLVAAACVLTLVIQGPPWLYWGSGLSENAAAGFIYAAALCAMGTPSRKVRATGAPPLASDWRLRVAAGVLATLGFYLRLNNLPLAFAVAVFAIPHDVQARDLWTPRAWLRRVNWLTVATIAGVVAIGMTLFALRTWYYTGHFSFFQGTTITVNSIYQPGMSPMELARRMLDSAWMVLSMNDPPRFVWYATPLVAAAVISIAALLYVPVARNLPLSMVLFFLAGMSGALVARGVAYSGRFSTIVIGSATAVTIGAIALAWSKETGRAVGAPVDHPDKPSAAVTAADPGT
jgi:hypothetical protein